MDDEDELELYGDVEIPEDEEFSEDESEDATETEEIHLNQSHRLSLECRDIQTIENLWEFTSVTMLYLNNNVIERIEGLDHLINLTWLNLSFNRIVKIEGLESLQQLEVLNLSNNRISVIENMDKLEKLTHFCITNNLIDQLDNVLYLRKFKKLFNLNLSGNPVSMLDDYKLFIAAYFPNLMSLDYRILDEKMSNRDAVELLKEICLHMAELKQFCEEENPKFLLKKNEASIKYNYVLEQMRREELQKQQDTNAEQSKKAELQLHTDAFVEFLNGTHLFQSMVKDDPEAETLHCIPEVAQLLQTFENQMAELCMQLFQIGLAEHKQRETEVNSFFSGQDKTVSDYQLRASQILANFEQQHKERIEELQQLSDVGGLHDKISHCNDEINQLSKSLMSLEFQLVSQMEAIIKQLDTSISDMVGNFSETVQGIFAQCRDLEDNYHQKMRKIAVETLEKLAKDDVEEDVSDDVRMLFTDRDTVMDALTTGHDNHLMKINDRETLLITRLNAWKAALIKRIQDKELKWNRMHISDIHRYVDHLKEQLTELQ